MATRKEQKQLFKSKIISAATEVFIANGFHNSTTKKIAKLAGVGEGTIFNHFNSKSDILLEIYKENLLPDWSDFKIIKDLKKEPINYFDDFLNFFLEKTRKLSKEWLRVIYSASYKIEESNRSIYLALSEIDEIWLKSLENLINELIENQYIKKDIDVIRVVNIMYSVLMRHFSYYSIDEKQLFDDFVKQVREDIHFIVKNII